MASALKKAIGITIKEFNAGNTYAIKVLYSPMDRRVATVYGNSPCDLVFEYSDLSYDSINVKTVKRFMRRPLIDMPLFINEMVSYDDGDVFTWRAGLASYRLKRGR